MSSWVKTSFCLNSVYILSSFPLFFYLFNLKLGSNNFSFYCITYKEVGLSKGCDFSNSYIHFIKKEKTLNLFPQGLIFFLIYNFIPFCIKVERIAQWLNRIHPLVHKIRSHHFNDHICLENLLKSYFLYTFMYSKYINKVGNGTKFNMRDGHN